MVRFTGFDCLGSGDGLDWRDADCIDTPEAGTKEFFSSWALFIMIMLLIFALFTSYILQQKKIQAVHETVLSIFAGERSPADVG